MSAVWAEADDPELADALKMVFSTTSFADVSEIRPDLFLCGVIDLRDGFPDLGITHVLSVTHDFDPTLYPHGCKIAHVKLFDDEEEDLGGALPHALRFIDEATRGGGRCLVHCHAGASRSASVVLAFVMLRGTEPGSRPDPEELPRTKEELPTLKGKARMRLRDALIHVKRRRFCVYPNDAFLDTLRTLDQQWFGEPCSVPVGLMRVSREQATVLRPKDSDAPSASS